MCRITTCILLIAVILISGCGDDSETIRKAEIEKHLNDLKDENAFSSSVTQAGLYFNFIAPEGVEAVPDLLEYIGMNINIEAHSFIIEAFITMGDAANEIILDSLDDESPTVRAGAAYTLSFIPLPENAFDKLIILLDDEDPAVRRNAAAAIQVSGPLNDDPIPPLTKLLNDADLTVRAQAVHTLGIYCSDDGILQAVISKLDDESSLVRVGAAAGLELAGPEAKSVIPKLFEMLNDEDTEVRRKVIHALIAISPEDPEVTMKLIERLGFAEEEQEHIVIHAFAKIGPYAEPAVPYLIDILMWHKRPDLQKDAAYALGYIGPAASQAIPALIKALDDPDGGLRWNAATSLGLIGHDSEEALTALQKTADNDANDEVRLAAKNAIEMIKRNK